MKAEDRPVTAHTEKKTVSASGAETAKTTTYASTVGDTTFIIRSSFTGTKTLADIFEDIIISAYRQKHLTQGSMCVQS